MDAGSLLRVHPITSDCTVGDLWSRRKTPCITLIAGNSSWHLQIGDFLGFIVERPRIRAVLHGVLRVSGHGMDGVLQNRAGNAWSSVRVSDENGLPFLAE